MLKIFVITAILFSADLSRAETLAERLGCELMLTSISAQKKASFDLLEEVVAKIDFPDGKAPQRFLKQFGSVEGISHQIDVLAVELIEGTPQDVGRLGLSVEERIAIVHKSVLAALSEDSPKRKEQTLANALLLPLLEQKPFLSQHELDVLNALIASDTYQPTLERPLSWGGTRELSALIHWDGKEFLTQVQGVEFEPTIPETWKREAVEILTSLPTRYVATFLQQHPDHEDYFKSVPFKVNIGLIRYYIVPGQTTDEIPLWSIRVYDPKTEFIGDILLKFPEEASGGNLVLENRGELARLPNQIGLLNIFASGVRMGMNAIDAESVKSTNPFVEKNNLLIRLTPLK